MSKKAYVLIRPLPQYRRDVFEKGLKRVGYEVDFSCPTRPNEDDVLVIWNRYGHNHTLATMFEARGARVIVAENGYLPMRETTKTFALALNFHNGAGGYPTRDYVRADRIDVVLKPWQQRDDGELLLLPQRGIGCPGVAMPSTWLSDAKNQLAKTGLRIRTRLHPGTTDTLPIEHDLSGVRAVATWASGAALKAIVAGVPAMYGLENWIGAQASSFGYSLDNIVRPDRAEMLERIGWAQWSKEEVETGEPFERLLVS